MSLRSAFEREDKNNFNHAPSFVVVIRELLQPPEVLGVLRKQPSTAESNP